MSSFRFRELKAEFLKLKQEKQEQLFALSCFQSDHIEAGFPVRIARIEEELKSALKEVYGHRTWRTIENRGDVDAVISSFEQGDAVNYMLAWYLEDRYRNYSCNPESHTNTSEFDVTLCDQDVPLCGIELKRAGSSNRISKYLDEHREKCEGEREARKYLLVILFPVSERMDSIRTSDLVLGYGPLSARTDCFYEKEDSRVANIPAPLFRGEGDIEPLREIHRELRSGLNIM